jgi:hypothetical protein
MRGVSLAGQGDQGVRSCMNLVPAGHFSWRYISFMDLMPVVN